MTKFFNKFEKPYVWLIFPSWGQKFSKRSGPVIHIPIQIPNTIKKFHKIDEPIQGNCRKDEMIEPNLQEPSSHVLGSNMVLLSPSINLKPKIESFKHSTNVITSIKSSIKPIF